MRVYLLPLAVATLLGLRGLAQQGDDAATAENLLITLQTNNDIPNRQAIEEIGKLGPKAKDAVPALMRIITQHRGGPLEAPAIVALGKIGPEAKAALPLLYEYAGSKSPGQDEAIERAVFAIGQIEEWSPSTTAAFFGGSQFRLLRRQSR